MRAILLLSWWQMRNGLLTVFRNVWLTLLLIIVGAGVVWTIATLPHLFAHSAGAHPVLSHLYLLSYLREVNAAVFSGLIALSSLNFISLLTGAALQFSLPDVYYLFPSPLARRLVLLAKMPAHVMGVFWTTITFYSLYTLLLFAQLQPYLDPGFALGAQGSVFLSVFFCIATYANLALTLEIVLGVEKIVLFRRIVYPLLGLLLAVLAGLSVWKGMDGLMLLTRQPILEGVFYPCHLTTQAALAPFRKKIDGWALAQLALFCAASLALLFSRRENYYETALRGSEAVAERRDATAKGEFSFGAIGGGRRRAGRDYTLPAFGRGAGALAWAHLTAAAKQPYANFLTPLVVGAAPLALTRLPDFSEGSEGVIVLVILGFAALSSLTSTAGVALAKVIALQPLVRPFPVPPRLLVLADLAPLIVNAILVGVGAGVCAVVLHVGHSPWSLGAVLILCLPAGLVCVYMQCYLFALLATTTQDKLRPWLIGTVGYVVTNIVSAILAGVFFASLALDVPLPISIANCLYACFVVGASFLALAERVYRKSEPGQT